VILAVTAAAATAAAVGNVLGPAVGCKASGGVIACNRINNIYIYNVYQNHSYGCPVTDIWFCKLIYKYYFMMNGSDFLFYISRVTTSGLIH
jgi:hypothetical protein